LFLVNKGVEESDEWMLVSQVNGREEKIVAPPRYSESGWPRSTTGRTAPTQKARSTSSRRPALPSFHYRPKDRALFEFVRWDGSDRLVTKVTVGGPPDSLQPPETFPVDVVHENGAWRLKWPRPTPMP
jgi:hypothetical protein